VSRFAFYRFFTRVIVVAVFGAGGASVIAAQVPAGTATIPQTQTELSNPTSDKSGNGTLTLPAGTKIQLAVTLPVWTKSVKLGADVYSLTAFPTAIDNQIAIPAGTYAQGVIDAMTLPNWHSPHAAFQMHFTKLIFANGYTVQLPPGTAIIDGTAIVTAYVNVSSSSDILLDNGSQLELLLQSPLILDAAKTAGAARLSKPVQLAQFKSATRCRPTEGTSGTPDTVIPGSPGTPDTVIPGGAGGGQDIVIPGTPATPPTVIAGTPGTAGTTCPGPPIVSSTPSEKDAHTESFQVKSAVTLAGQTLPAGNYQVTWLGLGPTTWVDIAQRNKVIAHVAARITTLGSKAAANDVSVNTNPDGTFSLISLQFKGTTFELFFNQGGTRP
jgi:hypothetical protein